LNDRNYIARIGCYLFVDAVLLGFAIEIILISVILVLLIRVIQICRIVVVGVRFIAVIQNLRSLVVVGWVQGAVFNTDSPPAGQGRSRISHELLKFRRLSGRFILLINISVV
jgi:hypothetical protein